MATYPPSLPVPEIASYSASHRPSLARTQMEAGPDRVIRLEQRYKTEIEITTTLSQAELSVFTSFYENDINLGADWFDIEIDTGRGKVAHNARIIDGVELSRVQQYSALTMRIETMEHN